MIIPTLIEHLPVLVQFDVKTALEPKAFFWKTTVFRFVLVSVLFISLFPSV